MTASPLHVDQSDWECVRVTGSDRVRFVNGMCTSNVASLADGDWVRASMLSVKGRIVAVFDIVAQADALLLLCEPGLGEKTREALDKHAIMDDVAFELVDQPLHRVWTSPADAWTAAPALAPCPEPVAPPEAVEAMRIAAGAPRYGVDITEHDFPFESRLREAIDYKKGCFLGQEPVARVAAQGRPNRSLMVLRVSGADAPARGTVVSHPSKPDAGSVTSSIVHPDFGPIALAYVHRSVAEPGTTVLVDDREATVVEPPLTA